MKDRGAWVDYLLECHQQGARQLAGKKQSPFDAAGRFKPAFNFCRDCTFEHAHQMRALGRCNPKQFHVRVVPAEEVTA
jgi:hypothetical protein